MENAFKGSKPIHCSTPGLVSDLGFGGDKRAEVHRALNYVLGTFPSAV